VGSEVVVKLSFAVLMIVGFGVSLLAQERGPVSVPEEEMQRRVIHRVDPVVAPEPGMRLHGTVVLKAVISKSGAIESLEMVSGHPMLVPAALDSVKQWRYRPYEVNGIPVRAETTVRVEFSDASDAGTETSVPKVESPASVTAEDMRGRLVYRVAPVYPPLARQARIQGRVILRIVINSLGEVRETQLISGHPMLAPAAVEAVKKWRYVPYESDGKTVEMQTEVRVIFSLAGT
jgi:TonB family protein